MFILLTIRYGPSPRVRGSPRPHARPHLEDGSIPARAGEPIFTSQFSPTSRVHPRACGGARVEGKLDTLMEGPSPRVRGSHVEHRLGDVGGGSIPARAGEPDCAKSGAAIHKVHPRACGGASSRSAMIQPQRGPSPRVRGSRFEACASILPFRSIPARAGEPRRGADNVAGPGVHPRACGGAEDSAVDVGGDAGPSPRVRGSQLAQVGELAADGSIPARAGEPTAEVLN